jgi:site-specific recombinase XerD
VAKPYPGVREIIRESFLKQAVQDNTIDIMISSLSKSTLQQYNTAYKHWVNFCNINQVDYFNYCVPSLLKFLTDHFENGANYGTLNSFRSALSLILGKDICNNDNVSRFFKGVFKIKPALPRYQYSWDPNMVLSHLGGLFPNESLSLLDLTKKLVTLLALSTGQRVQTLSLIDICNVKFHESGAIIIVDQIIKTSAPNRPNPKLVLPYFAEKQCICPVKTLSSYISRMAKLRCLPNSNKLILTSKKPHRNASPQSISRWIKATLARSGVDVSVFSAHSTRHASTSAARRAGVSVELIKRTAGWTGGSSCFAKFYNLPLFGTEEDKAFAEAILNS